MLYQSKEESRSGLSAIGCGKEVMFVLSRISGRSGVLDFYASARTRIDHTVSNYTVNVRINYSARKNVILMRNEISRDVMCALVWKRLGETLL